jgi:hypothetical protein
MRHSASLWVTVTTLALGWSSAALADEPQEKAQCVEASDRGQQLRDDGKYRLAQDAFSRCARDSCPVIVRQDCVHWLLDLDQSSATVVIDAKDDKGNDLADVTVTVDGDVLAQKLDGKPLLVDPGQHLFRYEAAGFAPVEEHVVIHTAEKNRQLLVRLGGAAVQTPNPSLVTPEAPPPMPESLAPEEPSRARQVPVGAWVFSAIAAAAFVSEASFGIAGLSERSHDLNSCAPTCPPSDKSSIQTKFAIADVSLGVGVVSAGIAAYYFFFFHPHAAAASPASPGIAVDFAPSSGGGVVSLTRPF